MANQIGKSEVKYCIMLSSVMNSRDTIPIRPTTNQVLCPQNTHPYGDVSTIMPTFWRQTVWNSLAQDSTARYESRPGARQEDTNCCLELRRGTLRRVVFSTTLVRDSALHLAVV